MDAQEALSIFLSNVLAHKQDRYLGFISKPKTRNKFLHSIYHELEAVLDKSKKKSTFPEDILTKPAFIFKPPDKFGESVPTLKEAFGAFDESFLAITQDGMYGVHGPETFIDSRTFYAAK